MGRTEAPVQAQMADAAGTTPLDQASTTTVLEGAENLTTVLPDSDAMATTVLEQNIPAAPMPEFTAQPFEIEFEITYIHTNEVIG